MNAEGLQPQVADHLNLVRFWAIRERPNAPRLMTLRDLQAAGVVGLIDACRLFDPTRPISFTTYATYRIRGEMMDEMGRFGSPSHVKTLPNEVLDGEAPMGPCDDSWNGGAQMWEWVRLRLHHTHLVPDPVVTETAPELPVIDGLGEDDVWILWRRFINRATLREVATDLGCTLWALKWRIKQLIKRLRLRYDGIAHDDGPRDEPDCR